MFQKDFSLCFSLGFYNVLRSFKLNETKYIFKQLVHYQEWQRPRQQSSIAPVAPVASDSVADYNRDSLRWI